MLTVLRQEASLRLGSNVRSHFHPRSDSEGRIDRAFETAFIQAP